MAGESESPNPTQAGEEIVRQVTQQAMTTLHIDLGNRIDLAAGNDLVLKCRLKRAAARTMLCSAVVMAEEHCPEALNWLWSELWRKCRVTGEQGRS